MYSNKIGLDACKLYDGFTVLRNFQLFTDKDFSFYTQHWLILSPTFRFDAKNVFLGEWSCEWEAESVSKEIIKDSFLEGMEL